MLTPVRCSTCHNDIMIAPGAFMLSAKAESTEDCGHCHQLIPCKDVTWHFCSVKCFGRLQSCKTCLGLGYTTEMYGEDNSRTLEMCETCKGVGLKIAL